MQHKTHKHVLLYLEFKNIKLKINMLISRFVQEKKNNLWFSMRSIFSKNFFFYEYFSEVTSKK